MGSLYIRNLICYLPVVLQQWRCTLAVFRPKSFKTGSGGLGFFLCPCGASVLFGLYLFPVLSLLKSFKKKVLGSLASGQRLS